MKKITIRKKGLNLEQLEKLENIRKLCRSGITHFDETENYLEQIYSETDSLRRPPFNNIRKICTEGLKNCRDISIFNDIYWLALVDHKGRSIAFTKNICIDEKLKYAGVHCLLRMALCGETPYLIDLSFYAIYEMYRRIQILENIEGFERKSYLKSLLEQ